MSAKWCNFICFLQQVTFKDIQNIKKWPQSILVDSNDSNNTSLHQAGGAGAGLFTEQNYEDVLVRETREGKRWPPLLLNVTLSHVSSNFRPIYELVPATQNKTTPTSHFGPLSTETGFFKVRLS